MKNVTMNKTNMELYNIRDKNTTDRLVMKWKIWI